MKNYEPADPLYETYVDNKGKTRRRKVRFGRFSIVVIIITQSLIRAPLEIRCPLDLSLIEGAPSWTIGSRRKDLAQSQIQSALSRQGLQDLWNALRLVRTPSIYNPTHCASSLTMWCSLFTGPRSLDSSLSSVSTLPRYRHEAPLNTAFEIPVPDI